MEWQISVWLEFAQEGCIRVKKKKIKRGEVEETQTISLISKGDENYVLS